MATVNPLDVPKPGRRTKPKEIAMNHHLTAVLAEARVADVRHAAAIPRSSHTRRRVAVRALGLRLATADRRDDRHPAPSSP